VARSLAIGRTLLDRLRLLFLLDATIGSQISRVMIGFWQEGLEKMKSWY